MAISHPYLAQLKSMIARLRDPYPLDDNEKIKLNGLLNNAEKLDARRRREEIWESNHDRLTSGTPNILGHAYVRMIDPWYPSELMDRIVMARRDTGPSIKGMKRAQAKIDDAVRRGVKNPHVVWQLEASLTKWTTLYQSYIDHVRLLYEKLQGHDPEYVRRIWCHRGEWTLNNLPKKWGSWEHAFWPDDPTSYRQAHIEVLEDKLRRLSP